MLEKLSIGWKVSTLNPALASLRYRALYPILALEHRGLKCKIIHSIDKNSLVNVDVLIIVKSFSLNDIYLAQQASSQGKPVIFDLCDNIFIDKYVGKNRQSPAEVFSLIAGVASAIVVTTAPLSEQVKRRLDRNIPVYVVPDGVENHSVLRASKHRLLRPLIREQFYAISKPEFIKRVLSNFSDRLHLMRSCNPRRFIWQMGKAVSERFQFKDFSFKSIAVNRKYLRWRFWVKRAYRYYDRMRSICTGKPPVLAINQRPTFRSSDLHILWFGNHGAEHANFGISDLLLIREALEKLAAELPVKLVVVSNNRTKFEKIIQPMTIPTQYVEWNAKSMEKELRRADVAVVPNSLDDFSLCKSCNRTVMALSYGVPVVATSTPALEPLKECIELDDFAGGIRRYLTDRAYALSHVRRGTGIIEQLYGQVKIGQLWVGLLTEVLESQHNMCLEMPPEILLVVQLPQDMDLMIPVLKEIQKQGIRCAVWTSMTAIKRWPALVDTIKGLSVDWSVVPDNLKENDTGIFPDSVYALLCISETSLNPHHFAHQITKLANSAGIFTATMQHGYENVGLSYSDDVHDIRRIHFASNRIFIWGGQETLHTHILHSNQIKCLPVGCPKPVKVDQCNSIYMGNERRPIIGVFENLHWHRYSDKYRKTFIESVTQMAINFPQFVFLVKPHNAGKWMTSHFRGDRSSKNNLRIIDPNDPHWASVTAPQLFAYLIAVITTPSTVALDAARADKPTAVFAQDMDLGNYEPLPLLHILDDWKTFMFQVMDSRQIALLQEKSRNFVDRVLVPGNATSRIIEEIQLQKNQRQTTHAA